MGLARKVSLLMPLVVWMALIFTFSAGPSMPGPAGDDISYMHVPAYFVLSALFLRPLLAGGYRRGGFLLAIIFATVYGAMMEAVQLFTAARLFEYSDMALNLAGSCIVLVFCWRKLGRLLLLRSQD